MFWSSCLQHNCTDESILSFNVWTLDWRLVFRYNLTQFPDFESFKSIAVEFCKYNNSKCHEPGSFTRRWVSRFFLFGQFNHSLKVNDNGSAVLFAILLTIKEHLDGFNLSNLLRDDLVETLSSNEFSVNREKQVFTAQLNSICRLFLVDCQKHKIKCGQWHRETANRFTLSSQARHFFHNGMEEGKNMRK